MNNDTIVEVFLGNPINIASERRFLARLRRDLVERGVAARILANVEFGGRQIDFVVITDHRVVQIEEKTFSGPILEGPTNGPWTVGVGTVGVRELGNPMWQARQATYGLSDALHAFSWAGKAPGPDQSKFYMHIDTVVCGFPTVPPGSSFEVQEHVTLVGYEALLDRLIKQGPRVGWTAAHWDAFCRDRNLYREEDDSAGGLVSRAGTAAVDAYLGGYLQAQADLSPVVPTDVVVAGRKVPRPNLAQDLATGAATVLRGPSEVGKTVWARSIAVELARAGQIPIWLAAEVCEASFRTAIARAIAPCTPLSPDELLRAAAAAGRAVVFVIDDLPKAHENVQRALVDGARAARLRNPTGGLLITAKAAAAASSIADCVDIELTMPDEAERRALLAAFGAPEIIDRCSGFVTPLELSLAATYSEQLGGDVCAADLLDRHVEDLAQGKERIRDGLRLIAALMHAELMPSLSRAELARRLRRDHGFSADDLQAVLECSLVTTAHGRVSFRHERFEHFLVAEALLVDAHDASGLAETLNTPRYADSRADAVALERDPERLDAIVSACEHPQVLVDAVTGRLGRRAAQVADRVLVRAMDEACAQTSADGITFSTGTGLVFDGRWMLADREGPASTARLIAVGQLLPTGLYVEAAGRLLDLTDTVCAAVVAAADPRAQGVVADQVFATTYALQGPIGLPASAMMHAASNWRWRFDAKKAAETAEALLRSHPTGPGRLYLAAQLFHTPAAPPTPPDLIVSCLASKRYHLRLIALALVEDAADSLDEDARVTIRDALASLPTDNLAISSSIVEALAALGEITPARDLAAVAAEIADVLKAPDEFLAQQRAYGIISAQFENEVIGPYYEAVTGLHPTDRERLLAMAINGYETSGWSMDWILSEITDLSDPFTRSAVIGFVARTDPMTWFGAQTGMQATVAALRLLAAAGVALPAPAGEGSTDPAWRASMHIIAGALADTHGTHVDRRSVDNAWDTLLGEERSRLASLLLHLRQMDGIQTAEPQPVHELVLAAMPHDGLAVLVWSLEHLDKVRSLSRYDHDLALYLVNVLGQIGGRSAASALRRLANDPAVGQLAAVAVRTIEARVMNRS